MNNYINLLLRYYDLIYILVIKEFKVRYKSNFLGYLWSVANPLSYALILSFAIKSIFKVNIDNYGLFLISALFPWQWFSNSVGSSTGIFLANVNLIKKLNFPKSVLVFSFVTQDAIHFILSLPIIAGFVFYYTDQVYFTWIYGIPLLILVQFILTLGLSLIISSVNVFFRDLERMVMLFLNFLFYVSPIFYNTEMIPEELRQFFFLNPLSWLIECWRDLFMKGVFDWYNFFVSLIYGITVMIVGILIYNKLKYKFAEVL